MLKALTVQPDQLLACELFDDVNQSFRPAAVGMAIRVEGRHERFCRADRGVVVVLPDRGDHFAFADCNLLLRQRRETSRFAHEREDRLEVLGEAAAAQRKGVPRHDDRQGDAAAVELFRDAGRRARRRTAVDDPREQPRQARQARGSAIDPARNVRLIATAGVVCVGLQRTTAPLSRTVRAGFRAALREVSLRS